MAHHRLGSDERRQGEAGGRCTYAALDLGTNNCRLLVARPRHKGFRVIDAFSRIVRLGEGMDSGGRLSEAAIDRTVDALKVCAAKMRRRQVTHARNVATEACRRAANGAGFLERVYEETGLDLEIISSDEEARLAVEGCLPLLHDRYHHALIFDIGGGSTELIWLGRAADGRLAIEGTVSLPCGVIAVAERHGGRHVPQPAYAAMVAEVAMLLAPFEAAHDIRAKVAAGKVEMLGTSGTVTTLAGVYLKLPRYDRAVVDGSYLTLAQAGAVSERIVGMSYAERVANPCIGGERADLVIAGTAIFAAICEAWPVGRFRIADRGLREGILLGLMDGAEAEGPRAR